MNSSLVRRHIFRAWRKHWALQVASVTVMTLVLMMLNLLFLGYSAFNRTIESWGHGLEMAVYLRDASPASSVEAFRRQVEESGEFEQVRFTSKTEATKRFLSAMGPDSLELLNDPKWSSPIPASFELKLSERVSADRRVEVMQTWSAKFKTFEVVEDVFYGQGWIENFSKFIGSARGLVALFWGVESERGSSDREQLHTAVVSAKEGRDRGARTRGRDLAFHSDSVPAGRGGARRGGVGYFADVELRLARGAPRVVG
ncbi:MAG: hypothetical protein HC902_10210 [Calothrix sp. SM1_5_4]|nr:hypothetical protein [Calothrix sp. SM1_5_4]